MADDPNNAKPTSEGDGVDAARAIDAAKDAVAKIQAEVASAGGGPGSSGPSVAPFELPAFDSVEGGVPAESLELLSDVALNVKIELGRTRMLVEDVLRLTEGAVVELDKLAGDPVDVYVNDRHVARGEVLVLNDNFCVRINEILGAAGEGETPPDAPASEPAGESPGSKAA